MATIIMHISIPCYNPRNTCSNLDRKSSKMCRISSSLGITTTSIRPYNSFKCNSEPVNNGGPTRRRSGNYKPSFWDFRYIQSLNSEYKEEKDLKRASELVVQVKLILLEETTEQAIDRLELIDDLQRLGISSHFEYEINKILSCLFEQKYAKENFEPKERDLYSTALEFRLLRQHGFKVSQEVFDCFKDEKGDFNSSHVGDTKGLSQLYEASFMLTEGEYTLELAKEFATISLRKKLDECDDEIDDELSLLISHALELPIHWRIQRPNVRCFIDVYGKRQDMNPIVLMLAKLDFNIVQAMHQEELKNVSRWWKCTRLAEKLPFARDRLVECYFWTIGVVQPRQYGYQRIMLTKINVLITIIDDIFDVYGTLEELQLFTEAIQRWDIEKINLLPGYMQICFLALYNFVNEMAYDVLKEKGLFMIDYIRKSWTDLIQTYLQEAKWYNNGYKPNLQEYLNSAWISISAPTILSQIYFLVTNSIKEETVESLYQYHDIVRWSGMILRLADDLATSPDEVSRGDVAKSIQCYMNERNASEEEAKKHVRFLIGETWKKMNKEIIRASDSPLIFSEDFIAIAVNLGRMAQFFYQYGDGFGIQHGKIHDQINESLFEPYAY